MPGFDKSRIVGATDQQLDEFTCAICLAIFSNPMVTQCCRQTYCKDCIREWVSQHKTCPNDRKTLTKKGLRPVPRVMINLLDEMKIKCDYEMDGCSQEVKLGDLSQHLAVCDYRPNQLCKTCGLIKECVSTHNCIQSLVNEKQKTDVKYLNLLDENSLLLFERRANEQLVSNLRIEQAQLKNNHQRTVDKLRSEHSKAVEQFKRSYARALEHQRDSHQTELDNLRQSYINQIRVVSDLEYKLSDYKWKLCLSEDRCGKLQAMNEKLFQELNSTKSRLFKLAIASFVLFTGIYFSRYF